MKLEIPDIKLAPGKQYCLHIPPELSDSMEDVEHDLIGIAKSQGKSVGVARWAMQSSGLFERFWPLRSEDWLARSAGISQTRATALIGEFTIPVADQLSRNAGTPRCMLGIAAALEQRPAVLIYSTCGLDPIGIQGIHAYVASKASELCLIHVSIAAMRGNRMCLSTAKCITIEANNSTCT